MNNQQQANNQASRHLGKAVGDYSDQYDPSLLQPVERKLNRLDYDIDDNNLPFTGIDAWNAYEVSFLTTNGLPISGVMKIVYPCTSQYIVESKSLKLYLNSFNMTKMGNTRDEAIEAVIKAVEDDLSVALKADVKCSIHFEGEATPVNIFGGYTDILYLTDYESIEFNHFNEDPSILIPVPTIHNVQRRIKSDLLRSNCRVTNQPDWGDIYIHFKGNTDLDIDSLLKYLVSFRKENHFHEEVCEMIYKRLLTVLNPDELMVCCLYTRRGGIDINPIRASHTHLIPHNLSDAGTICNKTLRQ
jgi:7-cyano-7-deazaguanine reductase